MKITIYRNGNDGGLSIEDEEAAFMEELIKRAMEAKQK